MLPPRAPRSPAGPLAPNKADPADRDRALRSARLSALRIVAGYAALASIWIFVSDRALEAMVGDPHLRTQLATAKGWFFVVATAGMLYLLIQRHTRQVRAAEEALRRREEQMFQAQHLEALGTLAGGVAHDFNNALTVIGAYTDLLCDTVDIDDPRREDLLEIRRATDHAAALTRQLLAYSRRQMLRPAVVDAGDCVREMHGMLAPLVGERVTLELDLPETALPVRADAAQLQQVLVNLVVNARDAMPEGGPVTISLRGSPAPEEAMPGWVALEVRDCGVGMDQATLARAFEPFFTTKPLGQGTGLGLATVYGIVSQSGGRVEAESAPGQGTVVRVLLPLVVDRPSPAFGVAAPFRADDDLPEVILLAEDEGAVRGVLGRALQEAGFEVLTASDGEEARQLLEREGDRVQLLLTDVVMPRLTGPALAAWWLERRPGAPVLFMSGYTDDERLRAQLDAGAALLEKPVAPAVLVEQVRAALARDMRPDLAASMRSPVPG